MFVSAALHCDNYRSKIGVGRGPSKASFVMEIERIVYFAEPLIKIIPP